MRASRKDRSRLPVDPDVPMRRRSVAPAGGRRRGRRFAVVGAVAVGGGAGAVARYALSLALPTTAAQFPWATFAVNVSGSAALGFLLVLINEGFPRGRLARLVLGTGVIGAYTTFSTFVVGAVLLARAGAVLGALAYVVGSLLAGALAVLFGMTGARLAIRTEHWLGQEA